MGLVHFDAPEDYSRYAGSLVAYETGASVPTRKEAVFFGTRHPLDGATQMSADYLLTPLADGHAALTGGAASPGVATRHGFRTRTFRGPGATKAQLADVFAPPEGGSRPALLFTASHGMGWPKGDPGQRRGQGALLCQDWPGVGSISSKHFFAAADLPAQASLQGLITFHFACFGAGTPQADEYMHAPGEPPPEIADSPFVAALPKSLLSHRNGGALACIGHVERAWGYSLSRPGQGTQLQMFEYALERMLLGQPVGYALKDFNERYAALSVSLANTLQQVGFGKHVPDDDLADEWICRNDSGGYLVVGDPAVRLRVADLA